MPELWRLSLAARVFPLAALSGVCLLGDQSAFTLGCLTVVAAVASAVSLLPQVGVLTATLAEGAAVGVLSAVLSGSMDTLAPYFTVPVLVAGMAAGRRTAVRALGVEVAGVVVGCLLLGTTPGRVGGSVLAVWMLTALGLGILGSTVHRALHESGSHAPYRDALALLRRLHGLSGNLGRGLDTGDVAVRLLDAASAETDARQSALLVPPRVGETTGYTPLRFTPGADRDLLSTGVALADLAGAERRVVSDARLTAVPLLTPDSGAAGVLVLDAPSLTTARAERLGRGLRAEAVQLSAALLYTEMQGAAIGHERARLAREVHDGIAQDLAALGYAVDGLRPQDELQGQQIALLRSEITRMVGELRHSVFELRNDTDDATGLAGRIERAAEHLRSTSRVEVRVEVQESGQPLRPEVETELLRIVQEGLSNARKHARATTVTVIGVVAAPSAWIDVFDDGVGPQSPRTDSYGLDIMRERAHRIGATVRLEARPERGSRLRIDLLDHPQPADAGGDAPLRREGQVSV